MQITRRPLKDEEKTTRPSKTTEETLGTGDKHDQDPHFVFPDLQISDGILRPASHCTAEDEPLGGEEAG
jgi:hypothetical protein